MPSPAIDEVWTRRAALIGGVVYLVIFVLAIKGGKQSARAYAD